MDATLAPLRRNPVEVFDDIGDIHLRTRYSGSKQRLIQNATGWSNEWVPGEIFFVAWLFTNEHHRRVLRPFAKDGLRAFQPQITSLATCRRLAQLPRCWAWGHQRRSAADAFISRRHACSDDLHHQLFAPGAALGSTASNP